MHQYKIQTIKYRLDWTGLGHGLQTGNLEPTKYNLVYQAIPEKIVKVDKLRHLSGNPGSIYLYLDRFQQSVLYSLRVCYGLGFGSIHGLGEVRFGIMMCMKAARSVRFSWPFFSLFTVNSQLVKSMSVNHMLHDFCSMFSCLYSHNSF